MTARRFVGSLVALAACAWLAACSRGDKNVGSSDRPRTVLLVTLDTFRTDRIGVYGGKEPVTPNLDALAARGVRFERCLSVAPITLPAHASMLSGVDPIQHGLRVNDLGEFPKGLPLLQVAMKSAGYATGAFVSAAVLDRRYGLARGFDRYDDRRGEEFELGRNQRRGRTTVNAALAYLKELADRPAFLWVHLFDAHAPYQAPAEYATKHADPYLAEMAYVDACLGDLLAGLRAAGRLDDALVAVIADHGEGLGDHGESTHTIFVYDTTIHVPFVLAGKTLPAGRSIAGTTSAISVAPTLLELCGIAIPSGMYAPSLAGAARGADLPKDSHARFESQATEHYYGFAPLSGIEKEGGKLIVAPRPEFYRPLADPGETTNLFERERKVADAHKRDLDALERERTVERPKPASPSEAQLREIRQLGYTPVKIGDGSTDPKDGIVLVETILRAQVRSVKDPAGAMGDLDDFLRKHEGVAEGWELLGDWALQIGHARRAEEAYLKAIALRGADSGLRVKLHDARRQLAPPDVSGAKDALLVALEKEPGNVDATIKLAALTLEFENDPASARRLSESAVRGAGGDRAEAYVILGLACVRLGDPVAAKRALETGMALEPTDWSIWAGLARLANALSDSVRERTCWERALAILRKNAPDDPRIPQLEAQILRIPAK